MHRRRVLHGLTATIVCSFIPVTFPTSEARADADAVIPILMFHKVDDTPQYPEDITSSQLADVLHRAWEQGFRPVNISDILAGRTDNVVPAGYKPLGITTDDAHPSILMTRDQHPQCRNAASFMTVLETSAAAFRCSPRATLFVGAVADDRISKSPEGYFGGVPLSTVLENLAHLPGVELGYHTRTHTRMNGMGAAQVRALLEDQMEDFRRQGVLGRVSPILAYPYGSPPQDEGIAELKKMGFQGAVLAFPGVREGRYDTIPHCAYAGGLRTDAFHIPRVSIGAFTYASQKTGGGYRPIDPLEDFRKDALGVPLYVSRGKSS